ncbi:trypsin-like serine protease [Vibrio algarum]|uniref:Trypsin-like serine protease n=1 Tax=Vibrio algarum TaxID=3020714 RepID=A0ABT4YWS0_9VIBR|nr:trypsin-like serine protease [Vibrio sp. KJ40-1]MDB1126027.1 trypsin-like serine protease [Vibrio sp. KJ40-1]
MAVGHGDTSTGVDNSTELLETEVDYVENSACTDYSSSGVPDSQLCMTGMLDSGTGLLNATCNGDSGGPLYWTEGSGKQVGITSYGPGTDTGCGDPNITATSVFTEVVDYAGWITNVKNGLVTATYTTSESDREYYRENGSLPNAVTDILGSGDGGGSVPLWPLLVMLGMAIFRKK